MHQEKIVKDKNVPHFLLYTGGLESFIHFQTPLILARPSEQLIL